MSVLRSKPGRAFPVITVKNAVLLSKQFLSLFLLVFLLAACKKEISNTQEQTHQAMQAKSNSSSNAKTTFTTTCFQAVAEIAACNGEDILFRGTIEMRESITSTGNGGTKITRSFSAKDLEGWGVRGGSLQPPTVPACQRTYTGTFTGTHYEVQGGAEMFNIHFAEGGSATLGGSETFIHRGTLVFYDRENNKRVVARHIITKNPAQGAMDNRWECGGRM